MSTGNTYTPAHTEGIIRTSNETIQVPCVLFDTGALHSSYVSREFVDRHRSKLAPYLHAKPGMVKLGDNTTSVKIEHSLRLPVTFVDMKSVEHTATVELAVFPMSHLDMIIGLPDILHSFYPYFVDLLSDVRHLQEEEVHLLDSALVSPWTMTTSVTAPEEELTSLPCSFPFALYYLSKSHEEAVEDFLQAIPTQVSHEMMEECPQLTELLQTKGVLVFVPSNWNGINGFEPIDLPTVDDLPKVHKPKARPINPRLYENAAKEFERLQGYFYIESTSPIASPLVIAAKATYPFIRFCGDYTYLNKYIIRLQFPIPLVMLSIQKAARFKIFIDIDLTNAFHQLLLSLRSSELLTVMTPWGAFRPRFLPEGVSPASAILQKAVASIFADFEDWTITIFDNILILADDYEDAYRKLAIFLDRCIERNVVLKFAKTFIGYTSVKFFGYHISHGRWGLTQERLDGITKIPMPSSKKTMQSFLGVALFCRNFIPNYSDLTAPLYAMTHSDYIWTDDAIATATATFEKLKDSIAHSFTLYFPDYSLEWILRTDASDVAVGSVLLQVKLLDNGTKEYQPLIFSSAKFSDAAINWDTHKKECYGIVKAVKDNEYLLRGKQFILETDHANLLHMETHTAPIVVRWRIYLQSFDFLLRHIKGCLNTADFFSRMCNLLHSLHDGSTTEQDTVSIDQLTEIFHSVHGGSAGHWGVARTYALLNKYHPGHNIPIRLVEDFVKSCPVCQKERLDLSSQLPSVRRHLHQQELGDCIAIDLLTVTPIDDKGNQYILTVVNLFSKLVALYPLPSKEATQTAKSLIHYFSTYGVTERIHSDQGSDYTSTLIAELTNAYGVRQTFCLVDHPEGNGVEGTNKQVLRHLRAMVLDYRCKTSWSDPAIIGFLQLLLNSFPHSETGAIPLELHFGTLGSTRFRKPGQSLGESQSSYLKLLDEDLQALLAKSKQHQQDLVVKKLADNPSTPALYQTGDFVLYDKHHSGFRDEKLCSRFTGPYRVNSQHKNDLSVQDIILGNVLILPTNHVKPFIGSAEDAYKLALNDHNQYVVVRILGYSGDPLQRSKCDFLVEYASGTSLFVPFSKEIDQLSAYETFCRSSPELRILLSPASAVKKMVNSSNKEQITTFSISDTAYLNIRLFGANWYNDLPLANKHTSVYRIKCFCVSFQKQNTVLIITVPLWKREYQITSYEVYAYLSTSLNPGDVLVDSSLAKEHPLLLKNKP